MKIISVEIYDIHIEELPIWHPILIRVNTDAGISGVGEVGLAYGTGHSAGVGMVQNLAESFMLGADPFKIEHLWERMFRGSFWAKGGGPVVYGGMSALDIALWDIKGKALNVPVYELLGGKTNEKLRVYASQIQFGWGPEFKFLAQTEEYGKEAKLAVEDGYDCIKVDPIFIDEEGVPAFAKGGHKMTGILPNKTVSMVRERIKAIRETVGNEVDIIIELHSDTDVTSSVQIGKVCEEFNCMYYEEPVHYLNVALQDKVTRNVSIPMAAGERLYTRWGYRQYFEKQTLNVIQPDLCLVGGITEGKKVCDYANIYDVTVQMHVCGGPVSTAAALHVETVIPNFLIHEHHTFALKDYNRTLCIPDYQPVNGMYEAPNLPGLGIELNDEVVSRSPRVVVK
jgi:L-alanine-DL-glutamate epimerase-like enolase superfamily enzyme